MERFIILGLIAFCAAGIVVPQLLALRVELRRAKDLKTTEQTMWRDANQTGGRK